MLTFGAEWQEPWRIEVCVTADLASARGIADSGTLEAWVHPYLDGPGKNAAFADGLAREQRFWRGPLSASSSRRWNVPAARSRRMPYCEPTDRRMARLARTLEAESRSVAEYAPLLVQYEASRLRIRDRKPPVRRAGVLACGRVLDNPVVCECRRVRAL